MAPKLHRAVHGAAVVITIEDHSLPMARFAVALPGGGSIDPAGKAGLARATCELLLRGTEKRSRTEFADVLEELGSSAYAVAGNDTTFVGAATLGRHLDATVELVAEAIGSPAFAPDELARWVDEASDDLRAARDDDRHVADLFLRRALYPGHPFARSPSGELADLRTLGTSDVRGAYEAALARSRATVVVAGDVDPGRAAAIAARLTARFAGQPAAAPAVPPPPSPPGLRIVVADKPERTQVQLRVAHLSCSGKHADALPTWLGAVAFGGTFTSPFTREVRDVRGWSYFAHADYDRRRLHPSPMILASAPAIADAADCLALELELYRGLARDGVPAEPVELARSYLLNRWPFQIATASDMIAPVLGYELLGLPVDEILRVPERIEALPVDAVNAALRRHLDPEAASVVMVATADAVLPELRRRFPAAAIEVVDFRDGIDPEETE